MAACSQMWRSVKGLSVHWRSEGSSWRSRAQGRVPWESLSGGWKVSARGWRVCAGSQGWCLRWKWRLKLLWRNGSKPSSSISPSYHSGDKLPSGGFFVFNKSAQPHSELCQSDLDGCFLLKLTESVLTVIDISNFGGSCWRILSYCHY